MARYTQSHLSYQVEMIPYKGRDPVNQQQTETHCLKKLWLLFTSIVYLKRYAKLACLVKQTELIVIEIYIEVRKADKKRCGLN